MTSAGTSRRERARNDGAGALAVWDDEGGPVQPDGGVQAGLGEVEERILQRLGAAVIVQWNELPTEIQRGLFQRAAAMNEPGHAAQLREEIARFLHDHKDDEAADTRARAAMAAMTESPTQSDTVVKGV